MRARWIGWLACVLVLAAPPAAGEDAPPKPAPAAAELLERLKGGRGGRDDEALDALVRWKDDEFVPAALAQLREETDFHARIALGYVLAVHGEKAGLEVLVDSLEQTGHLGYVYLTRVAPEDFGWNRNGSSLAKWRAWLDGLTEEGYREQVRRRRMSPEDRAAGRTELVAALDAYAGGTPRSDVAARLRAFTKSFPRSDWAADAGELADRLEEEVKEDAAWVEPPAPATLAPEARTAWLVFHLRDATGWALPFDGYVTVLPRRGKGAPAPSGPVAELLAAGKASAPTLLGLLEDRRPVRAWEWAMKRVSEREWRSVPVVLRYQDVALELLNTILPVPTYERKHTADYLSAQDPDDRAELIADVRDWAEQTSKANPAELRMIGVRRSRTFDALKQLRQIAVDPKQRPEALAELNRMYDGGRPEIFRPMICEVMADLGDTSKVADVIEGLESGKYAMQMATEEGDSAVGFKAEAAAQRIRAKYGKAAGAAPGPK